MIFKKNKKGTDKILSVYWFLILILVAGAIVYMVGIFYNYPYDVRVLEGNIMSNKISDCFSEGGVLKKELFDEKTQEFKKNFDLKKECNFNFDIEKALQDERGQYFIKVDFLNLDSGENLASFSSGNSNFRFDCKVSSSEADYKKLPECVERTFYSTDPFSKNKVYEINILSAIGKTTKNVK